MQRAIPKSMKRPPERVQFSVKLTEVEKSMLKDLAAREDRRQSEEIVFLIKRRLRELARDEDSE